MSSRRSRLRAEAVTTQPPKPPAEPTAPLLTLPELEESEVQRRTASFYQELKPSGELGEVLIRLLATMSVRMERCVMVENASLTARVRRAIADFVPPEGITDPLEIARLRAEASTQAMFDPSPEAAMARRYEASAQRSFFRALEELKRHEKAAARAKLEAEEAETRELLASFETAEADDAEFDAMFAEFERQERREAAEPLPSGKRSHLKERLDVPLTAGSAR